MTRHEVLEEFLSYACYAECEAHDCIVERMMADEIVRRRSTLAALLEPSEAVMQAVKDAIYEELGIEYWDNKTRRLLYYAVKAAEQEASA